MLPVAYVSRRVAFTLLAFCLPSPAQQFNSTPSEIPGIEVIGPSSGEFTELLNQLVPKPEDRAVLQPTLPYSFFVRNASGRAIRSLVARFEYTSPMTGKSVAGVLQQNYGAGNFGFASNEVELFTPSGALSQFRTANGTKYEAALRMLSEVQGSPIIRGTIDSAIFADNEFAGPDRAGMFIHLRKEFEQYRSLVSEMDRMRLRADDVVLNTLRDISQEKPEESGRFILVRRRAEARFLIEVLTRRGRAAFDSRIASLSRQPEVPGVWRREQ